MRAAILLGNVVGKTEHLFLVAVVPLHGHFHADGDFTAAVTAGIEHVGMQHALVAVDVLDETLDATREGEVFGTPIPLVDEFDLDTIVEEGQFADALGKDVVVEFDVAEDVLVGREVHLCSPPGGIPGDPQGRHLNAVLHLDDPVHGMAPLEFHDVFLAVTVDGQAQPLGQGVHTGYPHPVQTTGHLVTVLVELAARMQHAHDDFRSRTLGFMLVVELYAGRDAATVVADGDGIVRVDDDLDIVAIAGEGLVDRVVEHLEHHVMQTRAIRSIADVHARALAHRLQAFQLLDTGLVVAPVAIVLFHVKPFRFDLPSRRPRLIRHCQVPAASRLPDFIYAWA